MTPWNDRDTERWAPWWLRALGPAATGAVLLLLAAALVALVVLAVTAPAVFTLERMLQ
jgi:hypothetical protein